MSKYRSDRRPIRQLELVLKAASEPTRTRILKLLEKGGLCGCQVQAVLGLAPSTVSKHLAVLRNAGLVEDRRDGKWIEYALISQDRDPYVGPILAMLRGSLDEDPAIVADRKRLRDVKSVPLVELCSVPPTRFFERTASRQRRRGRRNLDHA